MNISKITSQSTTRKRSKKFLKMISHLEKVNTYMYLVYILNISFILFRVKSKEIKLILLKIVTRKFLRFSFFFLIVDKGKGNFLTLISKNTS